MFAHRMTIMEENLHSGAIWIMSTSGKTFHNERTPTYIYVHTVSDPVLDEKRHTTSTEHTLEYGGRKVLYRYNEATAINFCSASGANYAGNIVVEGYVVRWKYSANEKGEAISEMEPVVDRRDREEISQVLWPGMNSSSRVSFV